MHGNESYRGLWRTCRSVAMGAFTLLTCVGLAAGAAAVEDRKISDEKAAEIARETVPGEVMDIAIERKFGKTALVVEVITEDEMAEVDVVIDMETGEVLGIDR